MNLRVLALLIAGAILPSCSDEGSGGGGSGPVETATAYVEAIDERDGDRWCDLVAPYISGTLQLEFDDPDSNLSHVDSCGQFISGFIGYIEDCCPPEFVGASVKSAELGERRGRLQAVDLEVELKTKEDEVTEAGSREVMGTEILNDVVWLAEFDGEWRVAKLSTVAQAASLGFTIGEDSAEDDPLAPPDLDAQLRAYAAAQAKAEKTAENREASYREPSALADCDGVRVQDASGDLDEYIHPAPDEPAPKTPQADLRAVELSADDGRYCVRFVAAGAIEGSVTYAFFLRGYDPHGGFLQGFDVDLRQDGLVRVTSGEDEEDHPVAVPADVGIAGNELTLSLSPESLNAGEPSPSSIGGPPADGFAFSASATANVSERRALHDDLGDTAGSSFAYPSGQPCQLIFYGPRLKTEPEGCLDGASG